MLSYNSCQNDERHNGSLTNAIASQWGPLGNGGIHSTADPAERNGSCNSVSRTLDLSIRSGVIL